MPLIICIVFFTLLFAFEYAWHLAGVAQGEHALVRYERNEHPRRPTADAYIDALG